MSTKQGQSQVTQAVMVMDYEIITGDVRIAQNVHSISICGDDNITSLNKDESTVKHDKEINSLDSNLCVSEKDTKEFSSSTRTCNDMLSDKRQFYNGNNVKPSSFSEANALSNIHSEEEIDNNCRVVFACHDRTDNGVLSDNRKLYHVGNIKPAAFSEANVHRSIRSEEEIDNCCVDFACDDSLQERTDIDQTVFRCNICYVDFVQSKQLEQHRRVHTLERPYWCDVCNMEFTHNGNLNKHRLTHPRQKPYQCGVCGLEFNEWDNLSRHERLHAGDKPYKCETCGVVFSHSSSLKAHRKTHTGEKSYSCELCEFKCFHSWNLKSHMKIHTGEKPFKCDVCGSVFSQRWNLKTHARIHTGEKPYGCDICGEVFNQSNSLKKHKKTHTRGKPQV